MTSPQHDSITYLPHPPSLSGRPRERARSAAVCLATDPAVGREKEREARRSGKRESETPSERGDVTEGGGGRAGGSQRSTNELARRGALTLSHRATIRKSLNKGKNKGKKTPVCGTVLASQGACDVKYITNIFCLKHSYCDFFFVCHIRIGVTPFRSSRDGSALAGNERVQLVLSRVFFSHWRKKGTKTAS